MKKIEPKSVTFIVQGSVKDKRTVTICLKAIRYFFPESKIVLSTWKNSDITNLPFDDLVLSEDSCHVFKFYKHLPIDNNINKQLVSTQNGLKKIKTEYAVKLRTDIIFNSNNLLKVLNFIHKKSKTKKSILKSKIIVPYDLSINPCTVKLLFHFNDWVIAGETNDLRKIFNIPLMSIKDLKFFENKVANKSVFTFKNWKNNNVKISELDKYIISRYTPEQYIFKFSILRNSKLKFNHLFSFNSKLFNAHKRFLENEILLRSSREIGFINHKYKMHLFTDRVGFYTKIQSSSFSSELNEIANFLDIEKYFFKIVQLFKILLIKLSPKLYTKLKELN